MSQEKYNFNYEEHEQVSSRIRNCRNEEGVIMNDLAVCDTPIKRKIAQIWRGSDRACSFDRNWTRFLCSSGESSFHWVRSQESSAEESFPSGSKASQLQRFLNACIRPRIRVVKAQDVFIA